MDRVVNDISQANKSFNLACSQVTQRSSMSATKMVKCMTTLNCGLPDEKKVIFKNVDKETTLVCLNLNAETGINHCKWDMGMTKIIKPRQKEEQNQTRIQFEFMINPQTKIVIPMENNIAFMFNAYLLSHNQKITAADEIDAINFATYSNRRLAQNGYRIIQRMTKNWLEEKQISDGGKTKNWVEEMQISDGGKTNYCT